MIRRATSIALVLGALTTVAPNAADAQPAEDMAVSLRTQSFAVEPDGAWRAELDVDGLPTPGDLDGDVLVRVYEPVTTRAELAQVIDGDLPPRLDGETIDLAATTITATDETTTIGVDVPTATERGAGALTLAAPGIYPVTVTVTVDDVSTATHQTFLRRLPDEDDRDDPDLRIALVAALTDPGPEPSRDERLTHRADLERLAEYGSITTAPLTLALPPSLDVVLESDELLRAEVADALGTAELVALPHLTLDPSAAVAAGETTRFATEVREGEDVLTRLFPGVDIRRTSWIVQEPLTGRAAAALRDPLGFRLLLFDHDTYDELPGSIGGYLDTQRLVAVSPGDGQQDLAAAVVSRESELLAPRDDPGSRIDAAVELLTRLLVARDEIGPDDRRTAVLALDDFALPDAPTVDVLSTLVTAQPDVSMVTLSDVAGRTDYMRVDEDITTVELPDETDLDLTARRDRIELVRVATEAAASMLPTDDRRQAWQNDLDQLISTGLTDDEVDAALARITTEVDQVLASVEQPEGFSFTLTGRESPLRLNVRNNAEETRTVRIRPSSPKLRFPDGDQLVVLQPGINEIVIPVEARSNGTSTVEISLRTPVFDQPLGPPIVLEARVNAITGLGPMFTGAAVLLLVSWWFSHYRRKRRRAAADATPPQGIDIADPLSPDAAEAAVASPSADSDTGSLREL